mmetsp:Transcript_3621/g.5377  ORF Transcript_3621/g.5377 Transcript_3621/m.5377 type:complete len:224 (-) Transcript_3621:657-1328(-)
MASNSSSSCPVKRVSVSAPSSGALPLSGGSSSSSSFFASLAAAARLQTRRYRAMASLLSSNNTLPSFHSTSYRLSSSFENLGESADSGSSSTACFSRFLWLGKASLKAVDSGCNRRPDSSCGNIVSLSGMLLFKPLKSDCQERPCPIILDRCLVKHLSGSSRLGGGTTLESRTTLASLRGRSTAVSNFKSSLLYKYRRPMIPPPCEQSIVAYIVEPPGKQSTR